MSHGTDPPEERELLGLLLKERNLPYSEYGVDKSVLASWQSRKLISLLEASKKNWAVSVRRGGRLRGVAIAEYLPWDSKIFGLDIASLRYVGGEEKTKVLEVFRDESAKRGLHKVFARVRSEEVETGQSLESIGFRLMDAIVTATIDVENEKLKAPRNPRVKVRPYRKGNSNDEGAVLAIAKEAWSKARVATNHFHADPELPEAKSNQLYVEWARNSVNGRDDFCFLAEADGRVAGFVTGSNLVHLEKEIGLRIGALSLAAVAPWARGRGAFMSLAAEALRRISQRGARHAEIGTHITNYAVQTASSRLGLRSCSSSFTFHWSTERPNS